MKRNLSVLLAISVMLHVKSVASEVDTLRVNELEEVVVNGVFAGDDSPFVVSNIDKAELSDFQSEVRELPFLLSRIAGVVAWSDNGLGIGTTYLRIRGSGDSRINVTLDGVPLNSPEDECVFWANMNSYSAFLEGIQVQKGVGSSTNGDGAFGGKIALKSLSTATKPSVKASLSYGMYNSFNGGATVCSGLLRNHFAVDATYFHTYTDGFMAGTAGNSGSCYVGLSYLSEKIAIKLRNVFNYEKTGQAWNGVDTGDLLDGNYGVSTGLTSYKDFYKAGLGRYNNLVEQLEIADNGTFRTTPYTLRNGDVWHQTTDNFWQNKTILSAVFDLNKHVKTSLSLHYIYGYGFYNELKPDTKLSKFGLSNFTLNDGELLKKTDFVRKKGLHQNTFGALYNVNYTTNAFNLIGGFAVQEFKGTHFGFLTYIKNEELWDALGGKNYQYYDSDASKFDANIFAQATYKFRFGLAAYADLQYRRVDYTTSGLNDKFLETASGYVNQILNVNEKYNFFNPKVGLSYSRKHQSVSFIVALSHREPERNNFTDNGSYPPPTAERLTDYEASYAFSSRSFSLEATLYYMKYHNQFVQTGELSDIGEALTTNIKSSFRMGIELSADVRVTDWLDIAGNMALSKNRINDFDEVVDDWDNGSQTIHYSHSTLAFSPSFIANFFVLVNKKGWSGEWHTALVSRQFLDNTASTDRSLPSYTTSSASISYSFAVGKCRTRLGITLNNVFNSHYAASGWVYSAIAESYSHTNENRYREIGFYPMAGRNLMSNITISL